MQTSHKQPETYFLLRFRLRHSKKSRIESVKGKTTEKHVLARFASIGNFPPVATSAITVKTINIPRVSPNATAICLGRALRKTIIGNTARV